MTLTPAQIDKVSDELRSFLRVEVRSKKIKKLDPAFYKNVNGALETLRKEAEGHLREQDITSYIKIKNRIDDIERDFKALFQKRFEKIGTLSIYDLDNDLMGALTPEERDFIVKLHNLMQDQYNLLLNKLTPAKEPEAEAPSAQPEMPVQNNEEPPKKKTVEEPKQEYLLVRITGDQPPIAQAERDYYLHDNDVVYLPEKFAELLLKRKSAVLVNLQ